MTNDNAPAPSIEDKFAYGLSELIGMCMEAGMHPVFMIEPIEKELRWIRDTIARVDKEGGR